VYYSSTVSGLKILTAVPYLPIVQVYLDDIGVEGCNPWTAELLAVNEFNRDNEFRKIVPFTLLRSRRIFKTVVRLHVRRAYTRPSTSVAKAPSTREICGPNEYIGLKG
jgi:hypothetical protein